MSKPRNWLAVAAHFRRARPMSHRNTPKGGATNKSRDFLLEAEEEKLEEQPCSVPNPSPSTGKER